MQRSKKYGIGVVPYRGQSWVCARVCLHTHTHTHTHTSSLQIKKTKDQRVGMYLYFKNDIDCLTKRK